MRGVSIPFVVEAMSNKEDALGEVVPIPAAPFAGNIFCACRFDAVSNNDVAAITIDVLKVFIN